MAEGVHLSLVNLVVEIATEPMRGKLVTWAGASLES